MLTEIGPIAEYDRADLLVPAIFWTRKMAKEQLRQIATDMYACFDQWKMGQADEKGQLEAFWPNTLALIAKYPNGIPRRATDVAPWHCAGPFVHNEIDLAFKLWLDSDPLFEALLEKDDLLKVFSICGLVTATEQQCRLESLI